MNFGTDDNFAYRNPNYHLPSSSSGSASVAEGTVSGEEEYNLVDTHYVSLETLSEADANRLKSRAKYAQLGVNDMGVPTSPVDSSPERLPHLSAAIERIHNIRISGRSEDHLDRLGVANDSFASDRAAEFSGVRRLGEKNTQLGGSSYSLNADSLLSGTSARNFVAQQQQHQQESNFVGERKLRRTSVDNLLLDDNSSMNGQENDMSVDYSHHDFRSSFAVIDQAAKGGNLSGPGGVRVRKQGDTTVVTEHRDPYSFYWQLDQLKRPSPPPEPGVQGENVIEEMITTDNTAQVQSPDSHDSGIQVEYVRPSKPVKRTGKRWEPPPPPQPREEEAPRRKLPPGWERHEDAGGFSYYWHVDSGTIQREAPPEPQLPPIQRAKVEEERPLYLPKVTLLPANPPPPVEAVRVKQTLPAADKVVHVERPIVVERQIQLAPQQPVIVERAFKQTTTKRRVENDTSDDKELEEGTVGKPVRFAVRSLGWTEIAEEDLTPERSSRAVNRAIVDLSTGRNDLIDNVSKWGDGKELIMELDDRDLRLLDPDSGALLHSQPIHQIRVWGVGRDNGRDFAYVARDRSSRRFMCHVFRCDTPARTIANTLRDICKRLMIEKRPTTLATAATTANESRKFSGATSRPAGSSHNQQRPTQRRSAQATSFPTPMEEPKKVIRCHFLGVTQVPKATGVEILNEAVDRLVAQVRQERWILVDVGIAPSTITITEVGGNQITECRVRYLSFLGIGRDIKHCAFIMHTSTETFMCYVFHVEPSAGAMAKTIEAACKLRYQKVLDSHGERRTQNGGKTWGDSIRDVFGSLSGRRSNRSSQYPR